MSATPKARFFASSAAFRTWLEQNHALVDELFVGFWKKGSGKSGMSYPEAVDQALCFGWIDGVRHSRDEHSYTNRFTPRRARSNWSAVNLRRFAELQAQGLVRPPGLAAFEARDVKRTNQYSFEQQNPAFDAPLEKMLKQNRAAHAFWQAQPPGYRKQATWWVMSARRNETRVRRMQTLIEDAARGERIAGLRPEKPKTTTTKRRTS